MQRVKRTTAVAVLPTAPVGGAPGFFANPNPGGGVPATVPGYEWFNNVQEELCAVVQAAGITLDVSNSAQLLAALRMAGVFQSPAQFDNTSKAATTAFVQRALGNLSGITTFTSSGAVLVSDVGKCINVGMVSAGQTLSLPTASSVPPGVMYTLINQGQAYMLLRSGADALSSDGSTKTSFAIPTGAMVIAVSNGASQWFIAGPGVASQQGDQYAAMAANGYKLIPGGQIEQWVTVNTSSSSYTDTTLPITFPNGVLKVVASCIDTGAAVFANAQTTSNSNVRASAWLVSGARSATSVHVRVLGY